MKATGTKVIQVCPTRWFYPDVAPLYCDIPLCCNRASLYRGIQRFFPHHHIASLHPPPALSLIGLTRRCNVLFVEVAPHYRGLKMSCDICVNKTSFYKPYPFLSWMLKILHCSYWVFSEIPQISLHTLPASNERE